jgi:hypothetical protein
MSRQSHSARFYILYLSNNKNCKLIIIINKNNTRMWFKTTPHKAHVNFINIIPKNGLKRKLGMIFLQDRNTSWGGGGDKGVICVGRCLTGCSVLHVFYQTLLSVPPVNLLRHNLSTECQATPSRRPTSSYVNSMAVLCSPVVFQSRYNVS